MTKQQYLEMCEMMGSPPLEHEIPVELEDLPQEVQQAVYIYQNLVSEWEYMGGNFIGKNLNNLPTIFKLYGIKKRAQRIVYEFILLLDSLHVKESKKKNASKPPVK